MNKTLVLFLIVLITSAAIAQSPTAKVVSAANAFLTTLDQTQRQHVQYAYDDEAQRARWSNFPVQMTPRGGLKMGELTAAQRAAAMTLMSTVLSHRGYEKVQQIVEADEALKGNERGNPMFGHDVYFISFLGAPSVKDPWMLQFGGHHLALNITIAGERGILTPTLTGAQPGLYTVAGKTVRPLGAESDKGIALLHALDDTQQKQAILSFRLADLVLGPGKDGKIIQPEGLKASAMNDKQRAMLLDVIAEWAGIIHESEAAARMAQLKADINETWFAWSGPTTVAEGKNIAAYYRIQGPHLVIEYAPQQMGGDPSMHIHTMYRDPTNDYGEAQVTRRLCTAIFVLTTLGQAHRLDEYLQNTIISVSRNRLNVQMTLAPGVAVVPHLIASIDTDRDGIISPLEQQAYAARVLGDIALTIDGRRLRPRLISIQFPALEDMKDGTGEIQLTFVADLPSGSGKRKFAIENHHESAIAAYQVNCLASSDPDIRIEAQHRNYTQSQYELDYEQSGVTSRAWVGVMALVLLAGLVSQRAKLLQ